MTDTTQVPKLQMPKRYDFKVFDQKWRDSWESKDCYKWDPSKSRQETYAVDTPPPTVSGSLHIGHIFSYTHTDLIVRFQRMMGKNIFYPMGWDDNGLPTERRVQNVFGVKCNLDLPYDPNWKPNRNKGKKDPVEEISRANFIEVCSILTQEDEEVFKNLFQKLGLSVDWNLEYATINDHCRKISQSSFLDLMNKGEVYSLEAPTLWDVDFQTAVAQAEVEDREYPGFFHDIIFQVEGMPEASFEIATTRPELLPACIAVVAHPDDERYQNLFGKFAISPLFGARVPIMAADHADPEKGSGILMICTFGDVADVDWWKQNKMPLKQVIGRDGKMLAIDFNQAPFLSVNTARATEAYEEISGLYVTKARKKMAELLQDAKWSDDGKTPALKGELRSVLRPVKFYEKGDRPLEFISTRQWFVKILEHKKDFLKRGSEITWRPDFMKNRYDNWVEGLNQDWCISRQRYFGVPFPVWFPLLENGEVDYAHPILAKAETLPIDPLISCPPNFQEEQRNKPGGFMAEKDVMDTWATSSMTPQISTHWSVNDKRHESLFPMDLRPQSHEIIRTWAFYTIVKAQLHEGKVPWENVAISGWILDPDRKKMSKSKGNVVTPEKYLDQYGGDAVRYWAARARLGTDTAFDENQFKMGGKLCNKIFNASKFVLNQIIEGMPVGQEDYQFSWDKVTMPLDKAWINKMNQTISKATEHFSVNDYATALQVIEESFWNFCDHYVELVKGRSYSSPHVEEKLSAIMALDWSLQTFLKMFAPFFPYLTEEIWSWHYGVKSEKTIHLESWPEVEALPESYKNFNENHLQLSIGILSAIRGEKTKHQKKLKWPVASLKVEVNSSHMTVLKDVLGDLAVAGNVQLENISCTLTDNLEDQEQYRVQLELAATE